MGSKPAPSSVSTTYVLSGVGRIPLKDRDGNVKAWSTVDLEDFAAIARHRWHLTDTGYASRWYGGRPPKRKRERMARRIVGLEPGDKRQADHLNRNRLDNRRENLRIVDGDAENRQNVTAWGKSKYRGVTYDRSRDRWMAQVQVGGRRLSGRFATEEEAAAKARAWRAENLPFATD